MKKGKFVVLTTVLISASILGAGTALAAPGATEGTPAIRNTDSQVGFEQNEGDSSVVHPVDPIYPGEPGTPIDTLDPDKEVAPGTFGPLSLDFASSFNFGTQKITSTDEIYYAATQQMIDETEANQGKITDKPLYAQVTDNRGTLAGWTLAVKQNGQFKTTDGNVLNGAVIKFATGQLETASESAVAAILSEDVTLSPDGQTSVLMQANQGQAAGTWIYRLGDLDTMDKAVQLHVPGKSIKLKNTYSTTLTWVLSTLPSN